MKRLPVFLALFPALATSALASVLVSKPANGAVVTSPIQYTATASSTCTKGVSSMGIYVNNQRIVIQNGASLNYSLSLVNGTYNTVVQEWDGCGGSTVSTVNLTVLSSAQAPTVVLSASPTSINVGGSTVLTASAAYATQLTIGGSNGSSYTLPGNGGNVTVSPAATTTYTATATGSGGTTTSATTVTVASAGLPMIAISATPGSLTAGATSTLKVSASNATQVTVSGSDGSNYSLPAAGGSEVVSPATTTTYTAKATGSGGSTSASTTLTVGAAGALNSLNHVLFMLQENHSFDNYFGMLNPYRVANNFNVGADGLTYAIDGIDDKLSRITNSSDEGTAFSPFALKSTCVDDQSSAYLESYGDVNRWDFSLTRSYPMDGFVHTAEGFAKNCAQPGSGCSGNFTDLNGKRAMGYYDQHFLNYYYYMASQFALSDRWFSPVSSKTIPNRIATFSGGTTQGLVTDPGSNDHLPQLGIATIFSELDLSNVPWKIYYTTTQGGCVAGTACAGSGGAYPDTILDYFTYAHKFLYKPVSGAACVAPTQSSSAVGDPSNAFCIDPTHITPLSNYFSDLKNRTLPSFSFIEAGSGLDDEHPGSGQSVLSGQTQVASILNAFMTSPSWSDSAFFLAYDEGGGPYDHVPPVPGHSNQNTDAQVGSTPVQNIPDISTIAVNPDGYWPCLPAGSVPTLHCDLPSVNTPGGHSTDAPAKQGFAAQLGFRVPNMVISPFTRKHYVSHIPMDHTAVLKLVEDRFIGPSAHLTARDAAQPNLLDFFDFTGIPWATPPIPPPPVTPASLGFDPCTPQSF